jgi:hypothetical protein
MATVQLGHSSTVSNPFVNALGRVARQSAGLAMLLFGCAMLFTLWLIPVGLPLTLAGAAVISTPGSN